MTATTESEFVRNGDAQRIIQDLEKTGLTQLEDAFHST
jgi:hypothetical protein